MNDVNPNHENVRFNQTQFLKSVLSVNPVIWANDILKRRKLFFENQDIIVAESLTSGSDDLYVSATVRLRDARAGFWTSEPDRLKQTLTFLASTEFPDIASAANRLLAVFQDRDRIIHLREHPTMSKPFYKDFIRVLVVPAMEANVIREQHLEWMRPENNPHFEEARRQIRQSASLICDVLPQVSQLEQNWLAEILEYDPVMESEDETSSVLLGCGFLVILIALVIAVIQTYLWIF